MKSMFARRRRPPPAGCREGGRGGGGIDRFGRMVAKWGSGPCTTIGGRTAHIRATSAQVQELVDNGEELLQIGVQAGVI